MRATEIAARLLLPPTLWLLMWFQPFQSRHAGDRDCGAVDEVSGTVTDKYIKFQSRHAGDRDCGNRPGTGRRTGHRSGVSIPTCGRQRLRQIIEVIGDIIRNGFQSRHAGDRDCGNGTWLQQTQQTQCFNPDMRATEIAAETPMKYEAGAYGFNPDMRATEIAAPRSLPRPADRLLRFQSRHAGDRDCGRCAAWVGFESERVSIPTCGRQRLRLQPLGVNSFCHYHTPPALAVQAPIPPSACRVQALATMGMCLKRRGIVAI